MKYTSGSFTIEAAIIFPIILILIVHIMYLAFSLHDTVTTTADTYRYLICESQRSQTSYYSHHDSRFHGLKEMVLRSTLLDQYTPVSSNVTFTNYNNTEILLKYLVVDKNPKRKDSEYED